MPSDCQFSDWACASNTSVICAHPHILTSSHPQRCFAIALATLVLFSFKSLYPRPRPASFPHLAWYRRLTSTATLNKAHASRTICPCLLFSYNNNLLHPFFPFLLKSHHAARFSHFLDPAGGLAAVESHPRSSHRAEASGGERNRTASEFCFAGYDIRTSRRRDHRWEAEAKTQEEVHFPGHLNSNVRFESPKDAKSGTHLSALILVSFETTELTSRVCLKHHTRSDRRCSGGKQVTTSK